MCVCMHTLYVSQGKLVCINRVLANNKTQEGDELHVSTSSILCCLTIICISRKVWLKKVGGGAGGGSPPCCFKWLESCVRAHQLG